ncbi:MAG: hypothetical protein KME17_14650 [Cyanosarcina radialis HA8281-LM2]|nr:hypothetical protein [Cyanosarcina radialis HA8281-LM2]
MQGFTRLAMSAGLLSALFAATPGLAENSPLSPGTILRQRSNTTFTVKRQTGYCPKVVRLWTAFRNYEGGGEFLVVADTLAIAGPARLVSANRKVAEFKAPLKKAYRSCVGRASSEEYSDYRFAFRHGHVYFRVQLPPDSPSTPSAIDRRGIIASRPYVRWSIAD